MSPPNRLAASLVSLSFVALVARRGAAEDAQRPAVAAASSVAERQATTRLNEGLELAKIEKWEEARLAFQQAYALLPSAELLWNLGVAELNAGFPLEALRHFREYQAHPRAESGKQAALGKLVDRATRQVGQIRVDAAPGTAIQIDGSVPDPASWDGDSIDVAPGEHLVSAELGAAHEELKVTVPAGGTAFVRVGWYSSSLTANQAVRAAEISSGLVRAETERNEVASPVSPKTWVVLGLGAAAAASFAVAAGYGLSANRDRERAEAFQAVLPPSCRGSSACAEWRDVVAAQQEEARISTAFWISGGALAGAAIATFLFWPGKKPRETARTSVALVPLAGGGTVHLAVPY